MPSLPVPIIATLLSVLCASAACADAHAPNPTEAAIAARLVDAACIRRADIDEACDSAVLLTSETLAGTVDLIIAPGDGTPAIVARDIAVHGAVDGLRARLEAGGNGTLLVHSELHTHGRYPWFEALTIGQHDGRYQVIGYHYSTYDRAMGGDFACSVDLVAGDWHATGTRVDPESGAETRAWDVSGPGYADTIDVEWWSVRDPPAHCDATMDAWFEAAP